MNEYKWYDGEIACTKYECPPRDDSPQKKTLSPLLIVIIAIVSFSLVVSVTSVAVIIGNDSTSSTPTNASDNNLHNPENSSNNSITINPPNIDVEKTAHILDSVVNIQNSGDSGGFFRQNILFGDGTGAIVREDGYILTSLYIVENIGNITVTLNNGSKYTAEVYSSDYETKTAILKINANDLTPIPLGDSSQVNLGDAVCVIGNCINEALSNPITGGIVSGIDNNVKLQNGQTVNIMQIDASTLAGSTGGLVLNANGELIGMSNAMFQNQSTEIGIVTPINDLKGFLSKLNTTGNESTSSITIGISGTGASYGVILDSLGEGTPAEKSGLKIGDLIVKVDGEAVTSIEDITIIKNRHKRGDTITFTVYRNGEMLDIDVILE